jgi:hypothetical protein
MFQDYLKPNSIVTRIARRLTAQEDEESDPREEYSIRGEYWISKDGSIEFADGDIGDMNHEGLVIQRVLGEIGNALHMYNDDPSWEMIVDYVEKEYNSEGESELSEEEIEKLIEEEISSMFANPKAAIEVARLGGDAREFAMEYYGDKWCRGNNVTSWNLAPEDIAAISEGVSEIVYQETDEDPSLYLVELTIRDRTGKSYFTTLDQLEKGSLQREPETYSNPGAATNQMKKLDVDSMHQVYKNKPLGD